MIYLFKLNIIAIFIWIFIQFYAEIKYQKLLKKRKLKKIFITHEKLLQQTIYELTKINFYFN